MLGRREGGLAESAGKAGMRVTEYVTSVPRFRGRGSLSPNLRSRVQLVPREAHCGSSMATSLSLFRELSRSSRPVLLGQALMTLGRGQVLSVLNRKEDKPVSSVIFQGIARRFGLSVVWLFRIICLFFNSIFF